MADAPALRVVRIRVYPLKGAGGMDLATADLRAPGIPGDRRWMLVGPGGGFLSQRTHPKLCLIRVRQGGDGSGRTEGYDLEAPAMDPMGLTPVEDGDWVEVRLHGERFSALTGSAEADEWFTAFLGTPCRLVYLPDDLTRPVDPDFAPGHTVSFADGYPLHLTTTESLDDLNRRSSVDTDMSRYRPNLVVAGGAPWEEDEWRTLVIGTATLRLVKPCARCIVTTVDQGAGVRGREPLRTLRRFRSHGGKVYFGQNAVVERTGRFRVGSDVRIVERGGRRPPLPPGEGEA